MPLKAYEEFAQERLAFPIGDKVYTVEPVDIDTGLMLIGVFAGTDKAFENRPMHELFQLVLGPAWDEMRADGVPMDVAFRAGMTALVDAQEGREAAIAMWESGIDPEALAAPEAANQNPSRPPSGLDAIAQYGRGAQDPISGQFEWYDLPDDHAAKAVGQQARTVSWPEIVERWQLVVADFASEYQRDLHCERLTMRWPAFRDLTLGLLAADTRLSRHFQPALEQPADPQQPQQGGALDVW